MSFLPWLFESLTVFLKFVPPKIPSLTFCRMLMSVSFLFHPLEEICINLQCVSWINLCRLSGFLLLSKRFPAHLTSLLRSKVRFWSPLLQSAFGSLPSILGRLSLLSAFAVQFFCFFSIQPVRPSARLLLHLKLRTEKGFFFKTENTDLWWWSWERFCLVRVKST